MIEIEIVLFIDEDIVKNFQIYIVRKFCNNVKNVLRKFIESYFYFKLIVDKLYFFGGTVNLFVGIDFVDVFVDIYIVSGYFGEFVVKRNCFGWYVLG